VRDVLNGTLRFSRSILDDADGDIHINDNYYSPDSDVAEPYSANTQSTEAKRYGIHCFCQRQKQKQNKKQKNKKKKQRNKQLTLSPPAVRTQ
jgi:hypothetical protein